MRKKDNNHQNIESFISQGVEIKGDIISQGSIRIDGSVDGKLNIKGDLIVGEKGKVKGEVITGNLILAGKIEGNATSTGRFEITATGTMTGDVSSTILTIEEGGMLEGTSKMGRQQDKAETDRAVLGKKKDK